MYQSVISRTAFTLACAWLLPCFYHRHGPEQMRVLRMIASGILFVPVMMRLVPGSFSMALSDIAPVIVALLLLSGAITGLLLLHQMRITFHRVSSTL